MPADDIYEVVHFHRFNEQDMASVLHYKQLGDDGTNNVAAEMLTVGFDRTVLPAWADVVSAGVTFDCVQARRIHPQKGQVWLNTDIVTQGGDKAGEALPAQDQAVIQKHSHAADYDFGFLQGWLNLVGMIEADWDRGQILDNYKNDLEQFSTVLENVITEADWNFTPVIWSRTRHANGSNPPYEDWQNSRVQNGIRVLTRRRPGHKRPASSG